MEVSNAKINVLQILLEKRATGVSHTASKFRELK